MRVQCRWQLFYGVFVVLEFVLFLLLYKPRTKGTPVTVVIDSMISVDIYLHTSGTHRVIIARN